MLHTQFPPQVLTMNALPFPFFTFVAKAAHSGGRLL